MPSNCAALGCNSIATDKGRQFFKFPILDNQSAKTLAITQARQQAWLVALNRSDLFLFHYKDTRVCDLHFISGNFFRLKLKKVIIKCKCHFRQIGSLYGCS